MAKFRSPFGTNELWLTQTFHTGSNNTAIDLSATAGTPVYALADGKITYRSSGAGSYCIQDVDNSDLKIYYVHTYNWVGANSVVKKGQKICEIAPSSVNGGYPTHLHLGLPVGKYIVNYLDRSIVFKTKYQAIKDIWFKGDVFDWSKHKDLSYENTAMKYKVGDVIEFTGTQNIRQGSGTKYPVTGSTKVGQTATIIGGPRYSDSYTWWDIRIDGGGTGWLADVGKWKIYVAPTAPPPAPEPSPSPEPCSKCVEYQKQTTTLNNEINTLKSKLGTQGGQLDEAHQEIKKLEKLFEEQEEFIGEQEEEISALAWKNTALLKEKMDLVNDLNEAKRKLKEGQTNFIKQITDRLGEWLSKILGDRT
jgi:hypothetical protein